MLAHVFLAVATADQRDRIPVPRRTIMLTVNEFRRLFDTLLLGTTEPWSTCCTGQPCVDTPGIRRSVGNYRPGTGLDVTSPGRTGAAWP